MSKPKPNVLFLCTGNSARSQMAEAFLRHYAGDEYEIHSAGLDPKGVNPYAARVMAEAGLPLDGHTSTSVRDYLGHTNFSWLITVCNHAEENCPTTFLGISHREHWDDLDDPAAFEGSEAETLAVFRRTRDLIDAHVQRWLVERGVAAAT